MKIRVNMKTPDALSEAVCEAVGPAEVDLDDDQTNYDLIETITDMAKKKWFRYGECVTLEIDTDAGTCVVLENGR